ncbi:methyl-accepting chemotaxis protein, partial [Hydrogenophaga sp. XSHU_21]
KLEGVFAQSHAAVPVQPQTAVRQPAPKAHVAPKPQAPVVARKPVPAAAAPKRIEPVASAPARSGDDGDWESF